MEGEHYKRRELIDEDIDTARSIMEDKASVKRKAGVMKGFEGFVSNFLEPRLEEQRSDLNETKVSDLESADTIRSAIDISVVDYETETIDFKDERIEFLVEDAIIRIRSATDTEEIESIVDEASGTKFQPSLRKEANFRIRFLERRETTEE